MSLYFGGNEGVQLRDHGVYTTVTWADPNFARVFGLEPIAGRLYERGEPRSVGERGVCADNFGGAEAALGQVLHIENQAVEIAGVLPGWFDFPAHAGVGGGIAAPGSKSRTAFNYKAVGLLRPE